MTGKVLPYEVTDSMDKTVCKTTSLREAHRLGAIHCATSGLDTSVWQGERKLITYFGWKPQRHNRRVSDDPQRMNRRRSDKE